MMSRANQNWPDGEAFEMPPVIDEPTASTITDRAIAFVDAYEQDYEPIDEMIRRLR